MACVGPALQTGVKTSLCKHLDVVLRVVCGTPGFLFEFYFSCKHRVFDAEQPDYL